MKQLKTRQKVIDTATALFHRQGYQATGINQIVAESGVVKSSLYQHFNSKEELAAVYLHERHLQWFELLNNFIKEAPGAFEKVMAAFDFIEFMNVKEDYNGCAFIKMTAEVPANNETLMGIIRNHKEGLRNFFRTILGNNSIHSDTVYLLFESALLESYLFRNEWPVVTAKNSIHTMFN